jgi:hypothetical protein
LGDPEELEGVAPALRDCWQRFGWANRDGQTLNERISTFAAVRPNGMHAHTLYVYFQNDRWHVKFLRLIEERDERRAFADMAELFGSFLDNMRASLNYLAFQLANLAIEKDPSLAYPTLPWDDQLHPTAIEFPIFDKPAKYWSKNKVGELPEEYRVAVKAVQPCFGGNRDLWDLQELSAEYRHRVIHPVAVVPLSDRFGINLNGRPVEGAEITIEHEGPLVHDTEVMSFTVPPGTWTEGQGRMQPSVPIQIGLDHPLCVNRNLITIANGITYAVGPMLSDFEVRFFGS